MNKTLHDRHAAALGTLEAIGQEHVLTFYGDLDPASREHLLKQIEGIDWPEVDRLIQTHVRRKPEFTLPENLEPAPWYPQTPGSRLREKYAEARRVGRSLIAGGHVAAFTVAGGQGTRLGWDGPKGAFPATPIRGLPLFGCFAEYLRRVQDKHHCVVPWYIMTSPANHHDTLRFFEDHDYFGLRRGDVMLFPQAMMPAIDRETGKALLESTDSLALSPNGHGGSLKALYTSGALADMKHRGVEQISYTQVDNPTVKVVDPLFIGLHAVDKAQMSSKMLPKAYPTEKLGNFCLADGKITVIEYSDLPDTLAYETDEDGELRFRAGSIAIHVIAVDFVESLNTDPAGFRLPFHRADKKVPYIGLGSAHPVQPAEPNAVKLETFVFDALPLCETSIILEADRVEEFAPIKNADTPPGQEPANDSPETSKQLQIERAARWLEASGVSVARDADGRPAATIEISGLTAIEPADLEHVELPAQVLPGDEVLL